MEICLYRLKRLKTHEFNTTHTITPGYKLTPISYLGPVKTLTFLSVFYFLTTLAFAQDKLDSLQSKTQQLTNPQLPDSVKTTWHKVDSIRNDFNYEADSLRNGFQKSTGAIDAETAKVQYAIDSLNSLQLPSNKLTHKLDSLSTARKNVENDFNAKGDKIKSKYIGKLDKVEMTPEMEGPVGEFTSKIKGYNVTSNEFVKVPPLEVAGYSIPNVNGLGGISSELGKISGLGEIPKIETPLGDVGDISKQAQGIGGDIKSISEGNLNDVKQIPESIEAQAGKVDGIDELQKASGTVDGYKGQLNNMNNPAAMKQQGTDMARKEAINHFAGKQEHLKAAMDKLSGLKQKYSTIQSIKDLPKKPPNAMKGKPFIERIVPGIFFQFQKKGAWMFDVNPYAGYHISGKFTTGLGWNQRFVYDKSAKMWLGRTRIFGPRAYLDFKIGKGFIAHLEQEAMNTYVPTALRTNPEVGKREWVWSTMLGIKKSYKIYKNLNGTVLIQYNLFNQYFKTPYLDRLNSRMGFEYNLKKRVRKEQIKE
jgi:hypothetical protein